MNLSKVVFDKPQILCPHCGCLSPLNTRVCACGRRLRKPVRKDIVFSVCAVFLSSSVLIFAYFWAADRLARRDLEKEYLRGYNDGYSVALPSPKTVYKIDGSYDTGYSDGYNEAYEELYDSRYSDGHWDGYNEGESKGLCEGWYSGYDYGYYDCEEGLDYGDSSNPYD